jgi:hypothetical protein
MRDLVSSALHYLIKYIYKQPVNIFANSNYGCLFLHIAIAIVNMKKHYPILYLLLIRCTRPLGNPLHNLSDLIINNFLNSRIELPIFQSQIRTVEAAGYDLNRSIWP